MTTFAPPPTVNGTSPPRQAKPDRVSPATVVTATLGALLAIALLNCDQLVQLAQRMPYGSGRTTALHLADADKDVSHALLLDRPREQLDRWFGHSPAQPAPAVIPVIPTPAARPTTTPSAVATATPAPPSAAHQLRVFFGGDSIGEDVANAFQEIATSSKVVKLDDAARIATGLTRPDYYDWPARLQETLMSKRPPQVVIMMVGGNDVQPILTPTGPVGFGTAAWRTEYRHRVAATMALLTSGGADVYWVGQPVMQSTTLTRQLDQLDAIFASEAARHPGVTFIDARPLLADKSGHYAEYLPGSHGQRVQVRWGDGFHLTPAGATRVADAVWNAMRHRWRLPAF